MEVSRMGGVKGHKVPGAVLVGAHFVIRPSLRVVNPNPQHWKSSLQVPRPAFDAVSRLKFSLHASIDHNRITTRRKISRRIPHF
jgi:hypothetical protein